MRSFSKFIAVILTGMAFMLLAAVAGYGQLGTGETAPVFSLQDVEGKRHSLDGIKALPMCILYFFDVESRPSQEGLFSLGQLAQQYEDADLLVWGITQSPEKKVAEFIGQTPDAQRRQAITIDHL